MVSVYHHEIAAWMDGTESLTDGEYRAYHVIVQLIYMQNGPIVLNEKGIAGRCNQHPLAFRKNVQSLIDKGKLVSDAGKISNQRVTSELRKIRDRIASRTKPNPRPTPAQPPPSSGGGTEGVHGGSGGGGAANQLNLLGPVDDPSGPIVQYKKGKKKESVANATAPEPDDSRTDLFRRGLAKLVSMTGKPPDRCRPLIGKWLREVDDDCVLLMRLLEDCERHRPAEPMSWLAAAVRSRARPSGSSGPARSRNGFANAVLEGFERGGGNHDESADEVDARTLPTQRSAGVVAIPLRSDRGRR